MVYSSTDVSAFICRRLRAARIPNSEIHLPNWGPKARRLEKRFHRSNSAKGGQIELKFHRIVLRCSMKEMELKNPLRIESKMADDAQSFSIRTPISLKWLKLETSNLVCTSITMCNLDDMQKLSQRERGPVYLTQILNLRNPVNISRTAKAIGFQFST